MFLLVLFKIRRQRVAKLAQRVAAMGNGILLISRECRKAAAADQKDGIITKAVVPAFFIPDFTFASAFEFQQPTVRETDADAADERGCPLFVRRIAQRVEQLHDIRFVVAVFAGIPGGIDAGRATQRVNTKAAVVCNTGKSAFQTARMRLQIGVFTKRLPCFLHVCQCDARHVCGQHLDSERRQNTLHFGLLIQVMRRQQKAHSQSSSA